MNNNKNKSVGSIIMDFMKTHYEYSKEMQIKLSSIIFFQIEIPIYFYDRIHFNPIICATR